MNLDYLPRHICPSVCNNSDSTQRNDMKFNIGKFPENCGVKLISFESCKQVRYFTKDIITIFITTPIPFSNKKCFTQNVAKNQEAH